MSHSGNSMNNPIVASMYYIYLHSFIFMYIRQKIIRCYKNWCPFYDFLLRSTTTTKQSVGSSTGTSHEILVAQKWCWSNFTSAAAVHPLGFDHHSNSMVIVIKTDMIPNFQAEDKKILSSQDDGTWNLHKLVYIYIYIYTCKYMHARILIFAILAL